MTPLGLEDARILSVDRHGARMPFPSELGNQETISAKRTLPTVLAYGDRHTRSTFISAIPSIKTTIYAAARSLVSQHLLVDPNSPRKLTRLNKPTTLLIEVEAHALSLRNCHGQCKEQSNRLLIALPYGLSLPSPSHPASDNPVGGSHEHADHGRRSHLRPGRRPMASAGRTR